MQVALNHTIVPATDKRRSADFLAGVLGVDAGPQWGPFVPVALSNEVTLDYMDARDFDEHHYAFIVAERTGAEPSAIWMVNNVKFGKAGKKK